VHNNLKKRDLLGETDSVVKSGSWWEGIRG